MGPASQGVALKSALHDTQRPRGSDKRAAVEVVGYVPPYTREYYLRACTPKGCKRTILESWGALDCLLLVTLWTGQH